MVLLLRFAIALLAAVLTVGMAVHAWRQRSFGVACLALWMAMVAVSGVALVTMITPNGRLTASGLVLTTSATLLAGPLLLGYVIYAVRGMRLHWAWFLPFALHLLVVIALGRRSNLYVGYLPVLVTELAYTLMAWGVWLRGARPRSSQPAVVAVLAGVTAMHLGQVASVLDFVGVLDYRPIRQAPLVVVGLWLTAALVLAVIDSPLTRRLVPALVPPTNDADRALFQRIEAAMRDGRPWSDPTFDVGALARLLGTYPNAVSRALGRAGGTTFYDYVNRHRIEEARRLLADPREARLKIEALSLQVGFRARSTFFKLFREHTGQSPAEYRAGRTSTGEA